jgi:hypothetical protein
VLADEIEEPTQETGSAVGAGPGDDSAGTRAVGEGRSPGHRGAVDAGRTVHGPPGTGQATTSTTVRQFSGGPAVSATRSA